MKKIVSLILIFAILLTSISFSLEGKESDEYLVELMEKQGYDLFIKMGVSNKLYLNPHVYREQQKIVYSASMSYVDLRSSMPENKGADNVDKDGDYRYIGYNTSGEPVANELFEPDVSLQHKVD